MLLYLYRRSWNVSIFPPHASSEWTLQMPPGTSISLPRICTTFSGPRPQILRSTVHMMGDIKTASQVCRPLHPARGSALTFTTIARHGAPHPPPSSPSKSTLHWQTLSSPSFLPHPSIGPMHSISLDMVYQIQPI